MTDDQFKELVLLIRKGWSKQRGLILRLQHQEEDPNPLMLCVGALSNRGFVAQSCKVWQGDDLLYDGKISSPELQQLLNDRQICYTEINTIRRLDVKKGVYRCFGNRDECQKECCLRDGKEVQIGSLHVILK